MEIKSIAREGGHRSKVAVHARNQSIDPLARASACAASRIQNIVNELSGERIDVIKWDPDPGRLRFERTQPGADCGRNDRCRRTPRHCRGSGPHALARHRQRGPERPARRQATGWRIDIHSQSASERIKEGLEEEPSSFVPFAPGEEPDIDIILEAEEEPPMPIVIEPVAALARARCTGATTVPRRKRT